MPAPIRRQALSLRALNREYGFDRGYLASLVRSGDLPALRRGRALIVLREDFERWFRAQTIRLRPSDHDRAWLQQKLAQEEAREAPERR